MVQQLGWLPVMATKVSKNSCIEFLFINYALHRASELLNNIQDTSLMSSNFRGITD